MSHISLCCDHNVCAFSGCPVFCAPPKSDMEKRQTKQQTTTKQNLRAMASPMPRLAPVMNKVLPFRPKSTALLIVCLNSNFGNSLLCKHSLVLPSGGGGTVTFPDRMWPDEFSVKNHKFFANYLFAVKKKTYFISQHKEDNIFYFLLPNMCYSCTLCVDGL